MIKHIKRWNIWRKRNINSKLYKALVLFGIIKSPTMAFTLTYEETKEIAEAFEKAINGSDLKEQRNDN